MKKLNTEIESFATLIPVSDISSDPNQPRRTFEEINEMAESIKTNYFLQPIMVKRLESGFRIIFGERRYRAALLLKLTEIPARIKNNDITDEEVKIIQLVENIQRQDVHPMQQAVNFQFLTNGGKMNIEEIASSIGKTNYYVRQQLKLNDLTKEWQSLFLKNGIPVTTALLISSLPQDAQTELYSNQVDIEEASKPNPQISISAHTIKKHIGDLSIAVFDLSDQDLYPKSGSCHSCSFNTASASLFPEDQKFPRCNNIACFKNKTALFLEREIQEVVDNATDVLVFDSYNSPESHNVIKSLKENGTEVLKLGYGEDCKKIKYPEKPDWDKFKISMTGEKTSTLRQLFKKAEAEYAESIKNFENNLNLGKYKRALIVDSHNSNEIGRYIYVELTLKQSRSSNPTKKSVGDGNATIEEVETRIKEIQQKEIRAKQLDLEKIQKRIVAEVKLDKSLQTVSTKPGKYDNILILFILFENLNYEGKKEVKKIFRKTGLEESSSPEKYLQALQTLTKQQISFIIKKIMVSKYSFNLPDTKGGFMFRLFAESLATIPISEIEKDQMEISQKRQINKNREIAILKEMKAKLVKPTTKASTRKTLQKSGT